MYQLGLIMKRKKICTDIPIFLRNQLFKDISIWSQELKYIKENYQIPAICVVKMRFKKILYERGNILKGKKKIDYNAF